MNSSHTIALVLGLVGMGAVSQAAVPSATPGNDDWWSRAASYRTKYYNLKTDLEVADAKATAEHMDFTFESYLRLFSRLPVRLQRPAKLDLFLFNAESDYQSTLRSRFHSDGTGSWGQCITFGNSITLVGWKGSHPNEAVQELLQHEGFHQVGSHFFPGMPQWANEGLAEVFERGVMVDGQLVLGDLPARDRQAMIAAIDAGKLLPLEQLFAIDNRQWREQVRARDARLLYLQSWSAVSFLIFGEQGRYESAFLNFLVGLNRRVGWAQAFAAAFGTPDFKLMESRWLEFVRNTPPSDYRETVRRLKFLAAGMESLSGKGQRPGSLEELRSQLQEAGFQMELEMYGKKQTLAANVPAVFEVPLAEGTQRKFEIVEGRGGPSSSARSKPSPPSIVARGLEPQLFTAEWSSRSRPAGYTISVVPATAATKKTRGSSVLGKGSRAGGS